MSNWKLIHQVFASAVKRKMHVWVIGWILIDGDEGGVLNFLVQRLDNTGHNPPCHMESLYSVPMLLSHSLLTQKGALEFRIVCQSVLIWYLH